MSSSIGARPSIILEPRVSANIGMGIEFGTETYFTNRLYLLKEADGSVIANWADLKDLNIFTRTYARTLFARLNVLRTEYKISSRKDRVFEFDLKVPREKSQLLANLHTSNPTQIDPDLLLKLYKCGLFEIGHNRFSCAFV